MEHFEYEDHDYAGGRFAREAARQVAREQGEVRVHYRTEGSTHEDMQIFNDSGAKAVFDLGRDVHGRCHTIHVTLARLPDGTLGVRVDSTRSLTIRPTDANTFFATTHRPDQVK